MSQPVTFRTILVEADVIRAALEFEEIDQSNVSEILAELKNMTLPVLWEDYFKVGVARNFEVTPRGLLAELTVQSRCRDCTFSLTSLMDGQGYVAAYGGEEMDSTWAD